MGIFTSCKHIPVKVSEGFGSLLAALLLALVINTKHIAGIVPKKIGSDM